VSLRTEYLRRVFETDTFIDLVNHAATRLKEFGAKTPFDAIAFTGVSGAALAFPLSVALRKPLLCVRKGNESTHSPLRVEGDFSARTYIIVDDFIFSGATVNRITRMIGEEILGATPVGIYLYRDHGGDSCWTLPGGSNVPVMYDQSNKL